MRRRKGRRRRRSAPPNREDTLAASDIIRLGSRGSTLALWQAEHVRAEVERHTGKKVEITRIKTTGDMILDVPLSKVGGKG
ncbi:MAG TPA: hypothetical protein VLQ94_02355, partial [Candidatus Binatia bacterium]|nr:hypothetical protein [Candidatus Binatia bacterium]